MSPPQTARLALFDFDETLIRENSLGVLFRALGRCGPLWLEALGVFFYDRVYREGIRPAVKQQLYGHCLAGAVEADLLRHGRERASALHPIAETVRRLRALHEDGVEIWIVTATPRPFVQGIIETLGWPVRRVLGTEPPTLDGLHYSGEIGTECRREEKTRRIQEELADWSGEIVAAYGNAPDDLPMLALARQGFVVHKGRILT